MDWRAFWVLWQVTTSCLVKSLQQNVDIVESILKIVDPSCPHLVIVAADDEGWKDDIVSTYPYPITLLESINYNFTYQEQRVCSNLIASQGINQTFLRRLDGKYGANRIILVGKPEEPSGINTLRLLQMEKVALVDLNKPEKAALQWKVSGEIGPFRSPDPHSGFRGRHLRIGMLHFPPIVFADSADVYGIEPSVLNILSEKMDFKFEYTKALPSEMWGWTVNETAGTGLIGMLMSKDADGVIGDFYIEHSRMKYISFTSAYKNSEECFMVPAHRPYPKWTALYLPFQLMTWLATIFSYVAVVGVIRMLCRDDRITNWSVATDLLGVQQRLLHVLQSNSGRLVLTLWLFSALVLSTGYQSGLISHMTFPFSPPPIDTLGQLAKSSLGKMIYGKLMKEVMMNSNISIQRELGNQLIVSGNLTQMYSLMETTNSWAVDSSLDNLRYVMKTQFPIDSKEGPRVHIMRECMFQMKSAFGLQLNSPLKPYFDWQIQRLIEAGMIRYYREQFARNTESWNPMKVAEYTKPIFGLSNLQGAFLFVAFGLLFSSVIFTLENVVSHATK